MALLDDADRTEPATPRRREDARGQGHVALSTELIMSVLLLAGIALVEVVGQPLITSLSDVMKNGLSLSGFDLVERDGARELMSRFFAPALPMMLVILLALPVVAAAAGYAQVGFQLTPSRIAFRLDRLNPVVGLSRLFGAQGLYRLGHSVAKLTILAVVLGLVLRARWGDLVALFELPFAEAVASAARIVFAVLWWTAVAMLLLSLADLAWQRFSFERQLRMSRREVEEERKRTEGDPQIKARIKRAMRDMVRRRMLRDVAKATVVVTNPTHYAIALRYQRDAMAAPVLVAKGVELLARRIREIARENRIPIVEEPPLARALYAGVDVGMEIPPRFYKAVAAVLSYVFRLPGRKAS